MRRLLPLLLLGALPAAAEETLAVLAVADPPGPEPELSEMTHQLRAACRERTSGVQEVPEMRQRLLGQMGSATLAELERAYGGALATYQNGEYESSIRTLYAVIDDLEKLPEGPEPWSQWVRAQLRLAHAEGTIGHVREAREAMERVLALEPRLQPDPDLYSPTYRREFEAARARVAARPRRRLSVDALGWSATVYVNGKALGTAPFAAGLPPGRYRVGGAAGSLRVPSVWVELRDEDRAVALDFGLAEALRVNAGPGLALPPAQRGAGLVRAGAWLGVDRLLATSIAVESEVSFLVGSLYDVRRGAVQREGRVRMAAGAVPGQNLLALAAFLLTGQQSKLVMVARTASTAVPLPPPPAAKPAARAAEARAANETREPKPAGPAPSAAGTEPPPPLPAPPAAASAPAPSRPAEPPPDPGPGPRERSPGASPASPPAPAAPRSAELAQGAEARPVLDLPAPERRRSWTRPAAWGAGAAAAGLAGAALWQGLRARDANRRADGMVLPGGSFRAGVTGADYDRARSDAARARTLAWTAAAGSAVFAAGAGVLGWLSWNEAGQPVVRF